MAVVKKPARELAFWKACRTASRARLEKLLEDGADPIHGLPTFSPPLIAAAGSGRADVVELLLERGAPLAEYGAGALVAAAGRTDADGKAIVARLLADGALVLRSGKRSRGHATGATPLAIAVQGVQGALAGTRNVREARAALTTLYRVVERLLEAGADPSVPSVVNGRSLRPGEQLQELLDAWADHPAAAEARRRLSPRLAVDDV